MENMLNLMGIIIIQSFDPYPYTHTYKQEQNLLNKETI